MWDRCVHHPARVPSPLLSLQPSKVAGSGASCGLGAWEAPLLPGRLMTLALCWADAVGADRQRCSFPPSCFPRDTPAHTRRDSRDVCPPGFPEALSAAGEPAD